MARFVENRSAAQGKLPGEPVFIGKKKVETTTCRIIGYAADYFEETENCEIENIEYMQSSQPMVRWIDIIGLHDSHMLAQVAKQFAIHPLAIEDIANTGERAKFEDFGTHASMIVKMMRFDSRDHKMHSEQLGMIVSHGMVVTFQERPGDVFDPVRERIRQNKGRVRRMGADYLAYALLDTIVDNYLILIEHLGVQIETLESNVIGDANESRIMQIHDLRRELHFLYSSIRPVRDAIRELGHAETEIFSESTGLFFRDLHDLAVQAVEIMDTYREMLKDQFEMVSAHTAHRLNDVMKFLTIFSTVFIPMTLLAGIYGTNFDFMPELHWKYSYPVFLFLLCGIGICMIWVFKRKKWL